MSFYRTRARFQELFDYPKGEPSRLLHWLSQAGNPAALLRLLVAGPSAVILLLVLARVAAVDGSAALHARIVDKEQLWALRKIAVIVLIVVFPALLVNFNLEYQSWRQLAAVTVNNATVST